MPYKLPVKLSPADYRTHIEALQALGTKAQQEGQTLYPSMVQENLEPLLMHWSLIGSTSTLNAMCLVLAKETGLNFTPTTIGIAIKKWGLPPANGSGRGAARPTASARTRPQFRN